MIKFSVNTNGLKKYTIHQIVDMAVKLKLDGIEWGLPQYEDALREIRQMSELTATAGLEVVSYINGPKLWKKDDMTRWAEMIAAVGGKSLRVSHPWIAWNYKESLHIKESWHEIFKLAKDALPDVVELSRKTNVRFLLEMHSGALTASSLSAVKLLEDVDPRHVGVIYDPANTILEGNMRPRCDVEVLGKYLAYVHAKNLIFAFTGKFTEEPVRRAAWEYKLTHLPYGIVDYLEVFFALKTGGFNGYVSSEEYFQDGDNQYGQLLDGIKFLKDCDAYAPSRPEEPFLTFNG